MTAVGFANAWNALFKRNEIHPFMIERHGTFETFEACLLRTIPNVELASFEDDMLEMFAQSPNGVSKFVLQVAQRKRLSWEEPFYYYAGVTQDKIAVVGGPWTARVPQVFDDVESFLGVFDVLSGWKIVFATFTPAEFGLALSDHFVSAKPLNLHLTIYDTPILRTVSFENDEILLQTRRVFRQDKDDTITILVTMTIKDCFSWKIDFDAKTRKPIVADLENLFYDKPQASCFPPSRGENVSAMSLGRGAWMLRLMDAVHESLKVPSCRLTDASVFDNEAERHSLPCSARCIYAATHSGLSWYGSKGYLSRRDTLQESVDATNVMIREAVHFWDRVAAGMRSSRMRKDKTFHCNARWREVCDKRFLGDQDLVKFYLQPHEQKVLLDLPTDPTQPATFYLVAAEVPLPEPTPTHHTKWIGASRMLRQSKMTDFFSSVT